MTKSNKIIMDSYGKQASKTADSLFKVSNIRKKVEKHSYRIDGGNNYIDDSFEQFRRSSK